MLPTLTALQESASAWLKSSGNFNIEVLGRTPLPAMFDALQQQRSQSFPTMVGTALCRETQLFHSVFMTLLASLHQSATALVIAVRSAACSTSTLGFLEPHALSSCRIVLSGLCCKETDNAVSTITPITCTCAELADSLNALDLLVPFHCSDTPQVRSPIMSYGVCLRDIISGT